jgi:hypothetical protein
LNFFKYLISGNKMPLTPEIIQTIKDAARKLTGSKKREFIAQVTQDY